MKYKLKKLENGLPVMTIPMPSLDSATVMIWAAVGSRHETAKVNGISHFLEHMAFKGSKKRPSPKAIAEAVDKIGAETNASTSKEWTNFYVKTRVENLEIAFDVISDMLKNPILEKKAIEREKGVIVEEINMYDDTPRAKIGDVFENLIFKGSPLGQDIAGTKESVRGVTKKDFEKYLKAHYKAGNMLVTVSGGVEASQVEKYAKKYLGDLVRGKAPKAKTFRESQKAPQVLLSEKKSEQANFILGFRAEKRRGKGRYAEEVLAGILGQGMSSRLFTEVREKRGLAYSVKAGKDSYVDTGYIGIFAGVDPKRVDEAIKVVLSECYSLRDGKTPISEEELTKAKEYIKGHVALGLEDTRSVDYFFGEEFLLTREVTTPDEVYKGIDKVTVKDVLAAAKKVIRKENLNLAIIGPYKDKKRFEKLVK